jgi:hypothetical protein
VLQCLSANVSVLPTLGRFSGQSWGNIWQLKEKNTDFVQIFLKCLILIKLYKKAIQQKVPDFFSAAEFNGIPAGLS